MFTSRRTSSTTRCRSIRLSPIVEYSRLQPPVGVWTVMIPMITHGIDYTFIRSVAPIGASILAADTLVSILQLQTLEDLGLSRYGAHRLFAACPSIQCSNLLYAR